MVYILGDTAYISWVGDSKVVLGMSLEDMPDCLALEVTSEHRPTIEEEAERVIDNNG